MQPAAEHKRALAQQLQKQINALQGLGKTSPDAALSGFAPFDSAFPDGCFPKSALHEFISYERSQAAATLGFMTALAGKLLRDNGICLWIGNDSTIFPAGLHAFGFPPDRMVFIRARKPKDLLWSFEQALQCEALTAVIADIPELGFTESRRLQLAVERSGVSGFLHRHQPLQENTLACTTRWKITPIPGKVIDNLPGLGYPAWDVQLLKVRNGRPNAWQVNWEQGCFTPAVSQTHELISLQRQTA